MIVATAPELCQKCDFSWKSGWKMSAYVVEFMLTSAKMQDDNTLMWKKLLKLRLEHFESYSSFSYCTHSSVYRVVWPSGWGGTLVKSRARVLTLRVGIFTSWVRQCSHNMPKGYCWDCLFALFVAPAYDCTLYHRQTRPCAFLFDIICYKDELNWIPQDNHCQTCLGAHKKN